MQKVEKFPVLATLWLKFRSSCISLIVITRAGKAFWVLWGVVDCVCVCVCVCVKAAVLRTQQLVSAYHWHERHTCSHVTDGDLHEAGFGEVNRRRLELSGTLDLLNNSLCGSLHLWG